MSREGIGTELLDETELVRILEVASDLDLRGRRLGPSVLPSLAEMGEVLREAFEVASESCGVALAQRAAGGFVFDETTRSKDLTEFLAADGDWGRFLRKRQSGRRKDRLSAERIEQFVDRRYLSHKEDWDRLFKIAGGVVLALPDEFSTRSSPPKMRKLAETEVCHAINKLVWKQWSKGTVVLLPTAVAENIPGVHFSCQHWTTKKSEDLGRVLCDVANENEKGWVPINGLDSDGKEIMRTRLEEEWGKIEHPTISDICRMITEQADKYGAENITMWKFDLAAAFNLMDLDPDSAKMLAFQLTLGITVIYITGMFGWVGTPYVFQVLTRVLISMVQLVIVGRYLAYVDDGIGCSPIPDAQRDVETACACARNLLGPDAVAEHKTEVARVIDVIGWQVDLNSMLVTISRRNMLKTLYVFFSCNINGTISLRELQRMASLASRYAMLCTPMKCFTVELFKSQPEYRGNPNVRRRLKAAAKAEVIMWRAFLCLLHFDEKNHARDIYSFRERTRPTVKIEYDASLEGLACGISVWDTTTGAYRLLVHVAVDCPYPTGHDSSFQNTNEFLAVVLALAVIFQKKLVKPGFTYELFGDSVVSLAWVMAGRARSSIAKGASIGFALLSIHLQAEPYGTFHVAGVDNVVYDGLSRGLSSKEVGLQAIPRVWLNGEDLAMRYLALCDPFSSLDSAASLVDKAVQFVTLLRM